MKKFTFIFGHPDKRILIQVVASSQENAEAILHHYLNDEGKVNLLVASVKSKDILK